MEEIVKPIGTPQLLVCAGECKYGRETQTVLNARKEFGLEIDKGINCVHWDAATGVII
jgi:hypothetical protein